MAVKGLMLESGNMTHYTEMQEHLCICGAGFMSLLKAYKSGSYNKTQ
jgi:hypothetical protein